MSSLGDRLRLSVMEGTFLPPRERRSETRLPTDDSAVVTILQAESRPRLECHILDASKNGLRLKLGVPLEPGGLIQIRQKSAITMAEVRYCTQAGNGFHVGAKILSTI